MAGYNLLEPRRPGAVAAQHWRAMQQLCSVLVSSPTPYSDRRAAQELCDVLAQCLMRNPADRPSAERLLAHRFFARRAARDAPALVSGLLLRLAPHGAGSGRRSGSGLGRQRSGRAEASWGSEADLARLADGGSGGGSRSGSSGDWMGACGIWSFARTCVC